MGVRKQQLIGMLATGAALAVAAVKPKQPEPTYSRLEIQRWDGYRQEWVSTRFTLFMFGSKGEGGNCRVQPDYGEIIRLAGTSLHDIKTVEDGQQALSLLRGHVPDKLRLVWATLFIKEV